MVATLRFHLLCLFRLSGDEDVQLGRRDSGLQCRVVPPFCLRSHMQRSENRPQLFSILIVLTFDLV